MIYFIGSVDSYKFHKKKRSGAFSLAHELTHQQLVRFLGKKGVQKSSLWRNVGLQMLELGCSISQFTYSTTEK